MHSACDFAQFEHRGSCLSHLILRRAHNTHECLCGGGAGGSEAMVDGADCIVTIDVVIHVSTMEVKRFADGSEKSGLVT